MWADSTPNQYPSPLALAWVEYRRRPLQMAALYILGVITLIALIAPWLSPFDLDVQHRDQLLLPPAWEPGGSFRHFLGTDDLGRDMLSQLILGSQATFGTALLTVLLAAAIGISIGVAAGMTRGIKSSVLHHLLDTTLSIPTLLLAVAAIALFGVGLWPVLLAVLLSQIPQFIRSTRAALVRELPKAYVTAARLDGQGKARLFFRTLLPNLLEPLGLQFCTSLATAILDIAALGFLRLGAQSPQPEWGAMLSGGLEHLYHSPWMVALPGLALLLTVLSVNVVGEGLRHALAKGVGR